MRDQGGGFINAGNGEETKAGGLEQLGKLCRINRLKENSEPKRVLSTIIPSPTPHLPINISPIPQSKKGPSRFEFLTRWIGGFENKARGPRGGVLY